MRDDEIRLGQVVRYQGRRAIVLEEVCQVDDIDEVGNVTPRSKWRIGVLVDAEELEEME